MRRLALALLLAAALPAGATAAPPRITSVDTSGYPTVRVTVVTPRAVGKIGAPTENGRAVTGLDAANLGREKSVVLAVDRSQSMQGKALVDATGAARTFIRTKPRSDRIAVVAVGKRAVQLTGFSGSTIDADAALRTLEVDPVQGTALYDAVVMSAQALAGDVHATRVLVLLTDGQEVSSDASLEEAIAAARESRVAVYPIAIESPSFKPAPLKRLAAETGGRYAGAAGSAALRGIYGALAEELRRTWQLTYLTASRPGDRLEIEVAGATAATTIPGGRAAEPASEGSSLPTAVFSVGPALLATFVGACVLFGFLILAKAPAGTGLRRRIAPHLGEREQKHAKHKVEERFATASTIMRATEEALGHLKVWHSLHRLLERADLPLRTVELVYIAGGSGLVLGLIGALLGGAFFGLVAFAAGAAIPIFVVSLKAKRRLAAFDDQLPDLLITLAASLKAGHSFRQGIQAVVDEGLPPASAEFKRVLTETQLGRPMDDALADMAERVGSKNLSFVVTAVTIQRQVGGSLAGIFDMVAEAVRNRQQFARKIRALTAMGRASAYVLVGVPFFILGSITLISSEYMSPLYHTGTGQKMLLAGAVMICVGSLMLRKIVSFRG